MFLYYLTIKVILKEVLSLFLKRTAVRTAVLFCCKLLTSCVKLVCRIREELMEILQQIINTYLQVKPEVFCDPSSHPYVL